MCVAHTQRTLRPKFAIWRKFDRGIGRAVGLVMSFFNDCKLFKPMLVGALLAATGASACASRADDASISNEAVVVANADSDLCGASAPSETHLSSIAPYATPTDAAFEKANRLMTRALSSAWTLADLHRAAYQCLSEPDRAALVRQANEMVAAGPDELRKKLNDLEASLDPTARVADVEHRLDYAVSSVAESGEGNTVRRGEGNIFVFSILLFIRFITLPLAWLF